MDLVHRRLARAAPPCRTAATPLPRACPLAGSLEERARLAVRDDMARTLADAVLRRLDLGTAGSPPEADLAVVLRVMVEELGWSAAREQVERSRLAAALARRGPNGSGEGFGNPC